MAIAFVFPGQGSQAVGMGKALAANFAAARQVFDEVDGALGSKLSGIMFDGPADTLTLTENAQPALMSVSLAVIRVLETEAGLDLARDAKFVAGHSLGEVSALTAAGALSFSDGIKLVRTRGELMKRAGELNPGGMAAILGLDIPTLDKVCAEASSAGEIVQVANDNCPGQVVISGHKPALDRAIAGAKAAGAKRALPLAVSIAAHSPLNDSIQTEWNAAVDVCAMQDAEIPVVGNVHAQAIRSADDLRLDIKGQMQARVRWTESVREMSGSGIQAFVETGSGTVPLGLIKRIEAGAAGYPLGNPLDFAALD